MTVHYTLSEIFSKKGRESSVSHGAKCARTKSSESIVMDSLEVLCRGTECYAHFIGSAPENLFIAALRFDYVPQFDYFHIHKLARSHGQELLSMCPSNLNKRAKFL